MNDYQKPKPPAWLVAGTVVACIAIVSLTWYANENWLDSIPIDEAEVLVDAGTDEGTANVARTQWTPPMQRWFEVGNRVAIDFVHEDGWCAVAIQRPAEEEGGEVTVQCIK